MTTCSQCDRPFEVWTSTQEQPYHYTESGLLGVQLSGVTVYSCPNCGVESADIWNIDGLHQLLAQDILLKPQPMSGRELRFLRKEARLKPKQLADRLGVDPKTINNWEASDKLGRHTDISVRVLVAVTLWDDEELFQMLTQFGELARYGWDEETPGDIGHEIAQLAENNTILGLNANLEWDMAA